MTNFPLTLALSPQAGRGNTPSPAWAGEGWGEGGATDEERSNVESRSACPPVRELGLGGMKNIALVPGIGEASFILLISCSRFRDDRSIHGKVLPSPPMFWVGIKPPDQVHR